MPEQIARKRKKKSKKARRRFIRRLIPMLVAIVLIIIVAAIGLSTGLLKKYSYSNEKADLYDYFSLTSNEEAAIIIGNEIINQKALYLNGRYYLPEDMINDNYFDNYYYDEGTNTILYTTANSVEASDEASGDFLKRDGQLYLAIDYVQKYAPLEMVIYDDDPNHIEIKNHYDMVKRADIKEDTHVRVLGGIKSEVLTEVSAGDSIIVINSMDEWCKVKSADGYIGYVENKCLDNYREEQEVEPAWNGIELNIAHNTRDHKICLGWHQVMSKDSSMATLNEVVSQTKGMNVISPTWFALSDSMGNIENIGSSEYVAAAHDMGLEVWALADNFSDNVDSTALFSNSASRQNLINSLISAAMELGVDGINIDFEDLPTSAGPGFVQFIREISIPCRNNGLVLSVDNYVPQGNTSYYNRRVQGMYADYVIIMGYDEHYAGSSESGSVASFDYVQSGIEKTISEVDSSQIINGIPFYMRIWREGSEYSSEAVGMQVAQEFIANHAINLTWDDSCAQYYGETISGGDTYKIWVEDSESIEAKLNLMDANKLAGVACWKLSLESPDVWDVIESYMSK